LINVSGKLVIVVISLLALAAAGASWLFRYTATHRAAAFWGPQGSVLIREAELVELFDLGGTANDGESSDRASRIVLGDDAYVILRRLDISTARGLVHLRHALLDDRSFTWPSRDDIPSADWRWGLRFSMRGSGPFVLEQTVWFTSDCRLMSVEGHRGGTGRSISCEPIAGGLITIFTELTQSSRPPD
jgi:hypothetical protein